MKRLMIVLVGVLAFLTACNESEKGRADFRKKAFVQPAFTNWDIPFDHYTLKAGKGDTVVHPSGTVLVFPKNAFLDEQGAVVKGDVEVEYREFLNPLDFFVSGIPMDYDSAGQSFVFESSGMLEVNAKQKGKALFVNPDAQPEVYLVSKSTSNAPNLYKLDTAKRNWVCKGKPEVINLNKEPQKEDELVNTEVWVVLPEKPIEPIRADSSAPGFFVTIEPGSMKELEVYDDMVFEIIPEEKNYRPSDANIDWLNIEVLPTKRRGIYKVVFSNLKKKVAYLTRPVFEGAHYDAALQKFNKLNDSYNEAVRLKKKREAEILAENERIKLFNDSIRIENEKIARLNELINQKNEVIELANKEQRELIELYKLRRDSLVQARKVKQESLMLKKGGVAMFSAIRRSFSIDGFGVWNSDQASRLVAQKPVDVFSSFVTLNNEKLSLKMVNVVYEGFNGIIANHNCDADYNYPDLAIGLACDNMIWAVNDNKLYYLSYEDIKKYNINSKTKKVVFKLKEHPEVITSMSQLKDVLDFN